MFEARVILVLFINVPLCQLVELDNVNCGIDKDDAVPLGEVEIVKYPWLGILYYTYYTGSEEIRAVTSVALIQSEFVIVAAAELGPLPKTDFRHNSRVLLGQDWTHQGLPIRNYVLHPEYENTLNTIALVQLKEPIPDISIKPLCAPPNTLRNPTFYVMKFQDDFNELKKEVVPVTHVPSALCKEFYIRANLYSVGMRPARAACAVSLWQRAPCVWGAGSALVARDAWGRWAILGLGVRGPGCGAPSRYLDMGSYYPWIRKSLSEFRQITISKLSKDKVVLRAGGGTTHRFGYCDPEEQTLLIYQEKIRLFSLSTDAEYLSYNMTIFRNVIYTCLIFEVIEATATSELRVTHRCPRKLDGKPCHYYEESKLRIFVYITCGGMCTFRMKAWGYRKNMTLLDPQEWKWEEGTYYEDFSLTRDEYRGPTYMTGYGFEPLDEKMWVPEYDLWTTTEDGGYNGTVEIRTPTNMPELLDDDGSIIKWLPIWYCTPTTTKSTTTTPTTTTTNTTTKPTTKPTTIPPAPRRRRLPQRYYNDVATTPLPTTMMPLPRRRHLQRKLSRRHFHDITAITTTSLPTTMTPSRRRRLHLSRRRSNVSRRRRYHDITAITTTSLPTTMTPRRRRYHLDITAITTTSLPTTMTPRRRRHHHDITAITTTSLPTTMTPRRRRYHHDITTTSLPTTMTPRRRRYHHDITTTSLPTTIKPPLP